MAAPSPHESRKFALNVVQRLHEAGFIAFWAGGCVRDQLLGAAPKDYDVATNASPNEVGQVFGNRKTIQVGAAFGVVTVVGGRRFGNVEVATFRRDDAYSDGRRPDRVQFSSAEEDALRRDFTINDMFFDPRSDRVIDYVGGQQDLDRRLVRCIGDPGQRFAEDKLRLLRAIRFAAVLEFDLEPTTFAAIQELADTISIVSAERIANEMRRMLADPTCSRSLDLLEKSRLRPFVLPEFGPPNDSTSPMWSHALKLCSLIAKSLPPTNASRFEVVAAALLWPLAQSTSPKTIVDSMANRWKLSNRERELIGMLLKWECTVRQADSMPWSKVQPILIDLAAEDVIALARGVAQFLQLPETGIDFCLRQLSQTYSRLNPAPLVDGVDLLRIGIPAGPQVGDILTSIRNQQLDGILQNRKQAIAFARSEIARTSPTDLRRESPKE